MTGRTLAHYGIREKLGAGGMGEVYRAADTKLGRDVAVKVLPEDFARDPQRLARFEREARVLASLNHPNVAAIYGFEHVDGVHFLVLEYVPGETLKGPLPVDEALAVARQIAEGLENAHEKGIIHRDLKPANVKITPEGKVKILDFGLAKAFGDEPADGDPTRSPTLSALATRAGAIMGTAAYMSPEQARGRPLDRRTDIWSFGCVLYEMLAGKQAFPADTIPDALAGILAREPDWTALPPATPERVRELLRRCLQKDVAKRLRHIDDARLQIEGLLEEPALAAAPPKSRRVWAHWIAYPVLAIAALAFAVAWFKRPTPDAPTVRFIVPAPEKANFGVISTLALSPDGRRLVFTSGTEARQLWIRPLDSLVSQALPGTEGRFLLPFWSPDGRSLGFNAEGKLKKLDLSGGPPQTICSMPGTLFGGGAWSREGVIVFGADRQLFRVAAAGGVPAALTKPDESRQETIHSYPEFLPDGRHVLYFAGSRQQENTAIYVQSLDAGPARRILASESMARYAPGQEGRPGHLLFIRENSLMAQGFDPKALHLIGEPFPVAESVALIPGFGLGSFSVSNNGTLAYRTGVAVGRGWLLQWVDRSGKPLGNVGPAERDNNAQISPDQKRVAVHRDGAVGRVADVWIYELDRAGAASRFTFDNASDGYPVWSPDGRRIAFMSTRDGPGNLYVKDSSGAGNDELLLKTEDLKWPTDWSPDGKFLLYGAISAKTSQDLWVLPLEGKREPFPLLQTGFSERWGQFSPDGRWIAYVSDESGRAEVYVQSFRPGGEPAKGAVAGKWQVSTTGGTEPRWRRDGKELLYLSEDKIMAVEVRADSQGAFSRGVPKTLFEARLGGNPTLLHYAGAADGQRFLMRVRPGAAVSEEGAAPAAPITVVLNWARSHAAK